MNIYELTTKFDSRKSFYHKALVEIKKNEINLLSYETKVATIKNNILRLYKGVFYSNTTRRHVKEFALQHNVSEQLKDAYNNLK